MDGVHISNDILFKYNELTANNLSNIVNKHHKLQKNIIDNPVENYNNMTDRLKKYGPTASFPEFENVVLYLQEKIKITINENKDIEWIKLLGQIKLVNIINILYETKQQYLPYYETMRTICDILDFFDVIERSNNKKLGVYYHSTNYLYYLSMLLNYNDAIIFPVICDNLGATKFIQMQSIPIYFCSVIINSKYVDEYLQSPKEYFIHDVNHSRRMHEKIIIEKNKNVDIINVSSLFNQRFKFI